MDLVTVCVSAGWLGHRYGSYRVRGFPGSLPAAAGHCGDAVNSAELDGAGCEECLSSFWKKRTQPWRSADGLVPGGLGAVETQGTGAGGIK